MNEDNDSLLAAVDLHAWRVPPPSAIDRAALLGRALSPAAVPPRSSRLGWIIAAIVVVNAAIAALIGIVVRPSTPEPTAVVLPAGGGDTDARVRDLLAKLEAQQRELERKLAELDELHALIIDLSNKVRSYETDRGRPAPAPRDVPRKWNDRTLEDEPVPRKGTPVKGNTENLPELDRLAISTTMQSLRARFKNCALLAQASGTLKMRVKIARDGSVTNIAIDDSPDAELSDCVRSIMQSAKFPRTRDGGAFSYPLVF